MTATGSVPTAPPRALRLFIALELPPEWREALAEQSRVLEQAAPGFTRWVQPDLIHLTLVFLGSQPPVLVPQIQAAMDEAAAATSNFVLTPGGLGSFGGARAVRVIWADVGDRPRGALAALHEQLVRSLQRAGVSFEESAFRPHLTLGRARRERSEGSEAMHRAIGAGAATAFGRLADHPCHDLVLIWSDLRPSGPVYTPLYRAELGGS